MCFCIHELLVSPRVYPNLAQREGRPIFCSFETPFWEAEKNAGLKEHKKKPTIFGEGLISKMTSLDMIFSIILEGKYEYSSIYDLEIQPTWINFQESEGFFYESPFYSVLNMERNL